MVEVDGVTKVDPLDLVQRSLYVMQGSVEIDAGDRGLELAGRYARERSIGPADRRGDALRTLGHDLPVVRRGISVKQRRVPFRVTVCEPEHDLERCRWSRTHALTPVVESPCAALAGRGA